MYRITYDGSIADEPHFVVMGGTTEPIINALKESYTENAELGEALRIAVEALKAGIAGAAGSATPSANRARWGRRPSKSLCLTPQPPGGGVFRRITR